MWKNFTIVLLLISFIGLAWSSVPILRCPDGMRMLRSGQCAPTTEPPFDLDAYYS
uniref:Chemokine isoform 2 n=1 Tax=Mythimna separata TaxID=271217 RepID=B7XBA9_MYTSE|nr:chemokine isoform 2 [Mythimna separata]